ncbi:MAG: cytidine deaminase [Saprospiraceae bacterium]|nr:cytidine deaminase [Saprospiraceae bacterium]
MKQKKITISYQVFHSIEELSVEDAQLLEAAKAALQLSYSPYSEFRVGAAVLLANGAIVSGANQENAAYPMCLCAEQVALAAVASQYPDVVVKKMAITVTTKHTDINEPASPCGSCRQVICEKEDRQKGVPIEIILQGEKGDIYKLNSGRDLLPFAFDGDFLG